MVELEEAFGKKGKVPLSAKYNIPDYYLDFEYVNKCTSAKTLERILKILRSGEEGYYPQLVTATEERLKLINPSSKLLRVMTPALSKDDLESEELNQLAEELDDWLHVVNEQDSELISSKSDKCIENDMPEVRCEKESSKTQANKNENIQRIKSTDYKAWDKYDPDEEIVKMEIGETHANKEMKKRIKEREKKTVRFTNIRTNAESEIQANRERIKGNEFFKGSDYEEALHYYTNSIRCKSSATTYNNRAITFIRLKKYREAIEDCKMALKFEPKNLKSHLRMAICLEGLEKYEEALDYGERCIMLDANNNTAQRLVNSLKKKLGITRESTSRMKIIEIESETTKVNKPRQFSRGVLRHYKYNELVSIPGTSKMFPPYFEIIRTNSHQEYVDRKFRILNSNVGLLFVTTIDSSSDDENVSNQSNKTFPNESVGTFYDFTSNSKKLANRRYVAPKKSRDGETTPYKHGSSRKENILHTSIRDIAREFSGKTNDKSQEDIIENKEEIPVEDTSKNVQELNNEIEKMLNKKQENAGENQQRLKRTENKIFCDPCSQGEPFVKETDTVPEPQELRRPFNFLKEWKADGKDNTYKRKADILRKLNLENLPRIIGIKLDSQMFTEIINCLFTCFTVPTEIENLKKALINLARVPRFNIILAFTSETDRRNMKHMISFLDQHGNSLPNELRKIYLE